MTHTYEFPRAAITVDTVAFGLGENELSVLLVKRNEEPFDGCWALPGSFLPVDQTAIECAKQTLLEKTGVRTAYLEQLYTFDALHRDPRGRTLTLAYYALLKPEQYALLPGRNSSDAEWFAISRLPELAFDHREIVTVALNRLRSKILYQPIGFELLPEKFTMPQLQNLYEIILDEKLDRRNFSTKILKTGIIDKLEEKASGAPNRAPRLHRFNRKEYQSKLKKGFQFSI